MKKLYAYTDAAEKKAATFEIICDAHDENGLQDLLGIDLREATAGDLLIGAFSYITGIPESLWHKKIVDLTEEDVRNLIEAGNQVLEFQQVR